MACGAAPLAAQEPSALAAAAAMEKLVTEAIEKAEKSVVAIARVRREPAAEAGSPLRLERTDPLDPAFVPHEFGTGVVIDAKGLIVTAAHVLGNVREADYYVWISRKPYPAKVKAADPWLDLAVLQIDAANLKPITFGNARELKKGQFVIALGNPYAIAKDGQPSASWGIVSNLERQAPAPRTLTRPSETGETLHHWGTLIQTDARLELGASGGALVNLKGEMVGLTTSLAALYGYERPGGFAFPVDDDFRRALDTLKTGRLPDYGFLGVAPATLAADLRRQGRFGAKIEDQLGGDGVVPGTPAAAAGLKAGDVITHVEGRPVADSVELIRHVSGLFADSNITLRILRGSDATRPGRPMNVKVKLSKKRVEGPREGFAEVEPPAWRGLRVEYSTASPLFREQSRELDPAGCVGVVEVHRDSAAWKAGLRPGDFVSHVGQSRVTTPGEFYGAVNLIEGEAVLKLTAAPADKATRTVQLD
ncbi:MAG TPA: trypsin-like peptidase domain-containing protein [Pirellulaceae bacterium]|nr:trypsin-like peptidase domain-containing protein [Pirellulaceae bacterium]